MLSGNDLRILSLYHGHTRLYFGGVYSVDNLPHFNKNYPVCYIVNNDVSSGVGIHWVLVIVLDLEACIEWYD